MLRKHCLCDTCEHRESCRGIGGPLFEENPNKCSEHKPDKTLPRSFLAAPKDRTAQRKAGTKHMKGRTMVG